MERKYQVGDIVRVVATAILHEFIVGEIVEIIELGGVRSRYLAQSTVNKIRWYVDEEHIEAISETKEKKKFQVGDRVKMIYVGDTVNIEKLHPTNPDLYQVIYNSKEFWVNADEIKLVEEETKEDNQPLPATILDKAKELVYGDRERDYGSTTKNFKSIAVGWGEIVGTSITPEQVGLMLAWVKICRANNDNCEKEDSIVDLAGYAACIEKVKKGL
jgi:hypothetical protein